ncbi:unnamed protein product [Candidula unifasciata]|uniref:C2H2-type domain-containing protein n=1 Tax=Candidula unifasciata TaxID=100452 RepID=A0A8S3Z3P6_9EUPU|nr:unnamed protein product [Candidula unifasciata]
MFRLVDLPWTLRSFAWTRMERVRIMIPAEWKWMGTARMGMELNGHHRKEMEQGDEVSQSGTVKGKKPMNFGKTDAVTTKPSNSGDNVVYVDEESRHSEMQDGPDMGQNHTDDEKENKGTCTGSSDMKDVGGERNKYQKVDLPGKDSKVKDNDSDSADDEVEIIGETKVVQTTKSAHASQNIVFVPTGLKPVNQNSVAHSNGGQLLPSAQSSTSVPSAVPPSAMLHNLAPGNNSQRMPSLNPNFAVAGSIQAQQQHKLQVMFSSVGPPKPQSSLDQIELIRWEIQNRVNTRPKYFKPNPSSELGSVAKFLFNIGSDLIKEAVYHDLVKIQSKKKNKNKLNDKEKEDLGKLKEIEKDLYATIGHLKTRLKKRCSMCDFRTESINVMFQHNQYPHEDSKGLRCSHCSFTTKQGIGFRYHMESKHGIPPKLHDKRGAFECEFCPYENNNEQKLKLHKQRCIKQFRPYFNLHPSCLSGPEINLCLDNIFYKQVVPKNVSLLQQKHSHFQAPMTNAPMTNAQKQQAERKSLIAAQKTTAALAANKQLPQKGVPPTKSMGYSVPANGRMPVPVKLTPVPPQPIQPQPMQPQPMRFGPNAGTRASRPTIANLLNNQQNSVPQASVSRNPAPPLGAFEVCEICGGFVKDRKALRIHFFYAHRIDLPFNLFERNQAPLYCATCYVRFWTAQGLRKHIDSHKEGNQSRGVVGKCILCSHHVLNLLLHMRLVHNRDMQHYLNLNMCMFCGVKAMSRHECENHINNVHGHVDPISGTIKPPTNAANQPLTQQTEKTLAQPKKTVMNTSKKRCMCVLCNLEFSRNVDLTRHCMRVHHTCMKCGMVVADKPSLLKHVCLVSSSGVRDCDVCGDKGYHPAYYVKHLRDRHLKKLSVQMVRLSEETIERWTKHPCPAAEPVTKQPNPAVEPGDILVEISDDDDDDHHSGEQQKSLSTNTAEDIQNNASPNESGKNNEELADCERDTSLADQAVGPVEVIDIDTVQEFSEESRSSETAQGHKRKLESPTAETSPKRPKTP